MSPTHRANGPANSYSGSFAYMRDMLVTRLSSRKGDAYQDSRQQDCKIKRSNQSDGLAWFLAYLSAHVAHATE